jgi:hypothetical protein
MWCGSDIPDDAQVCPHCGEVLKTEEKRPIESPTIDSSSNPDFKISLEEDAETIFLHENKKRGFFLVIEKLSSSAIYGAEVQLSGPPHVKFLKRSEKIHATERFNNIYFAILAREPGFYTLTATLTSNVGHQITFPIKILVDSTKILVDSTKQVIQSSTEGGAIAAKIIIGLIGGILLLGGIVMFITGGFGQGLNFALAATLTVIGFLILSCILGIASKGECCGCLTGCT